MNTQIVLRQTGNCGKVYNVCHITMQKKGFTKYIDYFGNHINEQLVIRTEFADPCSVSGMRYSRTYFEANDDNAIELIQKKIKNAKRIGWILV